MFYSTCYKKFFYNLINDTPPVKTYFDIYKIMVFKVFTSTAQNCGHFEKNMGIQSFSSLATDHIRKVLFNLKIIKFSFQICREITLHQLAVF